MATLVSHFKFDNDYTDFLGNNNLAANGSGNAFSTAIRKVGAYSLSLNGSGQARKTSNFATISTGNADLSFGGWYNLAGYSARQQLIDFGTVTGSQQWLLYIDNSTTISLELRGAQTKTWTPSALATSTWYWFWIEYTATSKVATLYIDNVSQGDLTFTSTPNITAGPIYVGGNDINGDNITGNLDDLRIYNGVTTSGERAAIYSEGIPSPSGLVFTTI